MTSSMMVGEKKWASARRSGMTVLGKVAVPKPLNLPSQKLENHGLDPNVEIVPKGTIGWGSQSSSVPNAWGSSSVSPKADGSSLSPNHLNGRPSSGSGTRPSTGGSERTQDATSSVWGQTSRPSSASGALTSNQTALTSLRPRSADTRPGSSQLSRFAEHPPDNSHTWSPNGAVNKPGIRPSNNDGFSLSSGDFPTLGSEKDSSGKNLDSQECGYNSRPGSSSSRAASGKEKNITSSIGNVVDGGSANTWTRDGSQHAEHGFQPSFERWHGDMPPGGNPYRPPQNFDAWRGPPVNHPPRGWYPRPPMGPPYGPPLHPSGYPMEPPYPFYHPQMPPNNPQQVPPGATPRGHHPNNPQQVLPGPTPRGHHPNNPQQIPPGAAPRGHHPKSGEFRPHAPEGYVHPRMPINPGFYPPPYEGFYGPPIGYCNPNERDMPFMGMPPGPPVYKRNPYDNAIDPQSRSPVHGSRGKPSTPERLEPKSGNFDDTRGPYKVLLKPSKDTWEEKRDEGEWDHGVPSNTPCIEKKIHPGSKLRKNEWGLEEDQGTYPLDSTKLPESRGKMNIGVDSFGNKTGNETSFQQPSQILLASPKSSTLMQKIDGLNSKTRNFDGRSDVPTLSHREDQYNQPHTTRTAPSRRPTHGAQSRVDHRGKRLNNQDVDGWRKNPLDGESSAEILVTHLETNPNVLVCDRSNNLEESGKSGYKLQGKDDIDHSLRFYDESDNIAQRAKMREIAKQRAEKLQKEEEERTREQKAKALAKLEELNRKLEKAPPAQQEEERSRKPVEPNADSSKSEISSSTVVRNRKDNIRASNSIMVGENTIVFDGSILGKPDNLPKSEVAIGEVVPQVSDGSVSKHKRTEYKQRQNVNSMKNVTEKSISLTQPGENVVIEIASSNESLLVISSNVITDLSMPNKRKNSRSSKNKLIRVDEVAPVPVVLPTVAKAVVPSKVANEINVAKVSTEKPELTTDLPQSKAVEQRAFSVEETSGKGNHQWKPQPPRRIPKNPQGINRVGEREKPHGSETVTWAPVRSQDKIEPVDKSESVNNFTNAKVDSVVQNSTKTKRAEMERYVPKPVAKELAQQGSVQPPVVAQNIESTQHDEPGTGYVDSKQRKPGPWKQRVYVESALNQGLQETGKSVQKLNEQNHPLKSDVESSKEQTNDGWNSNDNSGTSAPIATKGRGNRHPFKGNRSMGNNYELAHGNEPSSESASAPEMNRTDKNNALNENRSVGERTAKWQPKNQVYSVHNRRNRPNEEQMSPPANKAQVDQSHSKLVNVEEAHVVHQDLKTERKPSSSRGNAGKITAEFHDVYENNDQQFSSGYHKNGNHYNRSGRGHEPRGDVPFNRERPRQISHFEYQPVGHGGNNKSNNFEEGSTEGSHNMEPKYRERNQGYSRRGGGNFYGRQSGPGRGDARYD